MDVLGALWERWLAIEVRREMALCARGKAADELILLPPG